MQIHRDINNRKIWFSQKNYLKKILRRFNIQDCKPISFHFLLISSYPQVSVLTMKQRWMRYLEYHMYQQWEYMMFTMIYTRTDIAQAMGAVSLYMTNPGREQWIAVKRILRCIKGTSDVVLCYGGSEFTVRGYVDLDFAGNLDKKKSTTGCVFTLTGAAVSWVSKL